MKIFPFFFSLLASSTGTLAVQLGDGTAPSHSIPPSYVACFIAVTVFVRGRFGFVCCVWFWHDDFFSTFDAVSWNVVYSVFCVVFFFVLALAAFICLD
jgi:hypothetical protein